MKNIFKYGLVLVAAVVSLASCSDNDYEYTPAEALANSQVYFPTTDPSSISLDMNATSYGVTLSRVKTDEDLTVNLVSTITTEGAQDLLSIPSSVTFAKGQSSVEIPLTYDGNAIGFDNPIEGTIAISDDSYTTPYGTSSYSFTAKIPSPWTSLGTCSFYEGFWMGVEYTCEIQQNDLDPQSFRLINPFPSSDYEQATDMLEFRVYKAGETLLGQTLTQDVVYWDYNNAALSYYSDYDDIIYMVFPGAFSKYATEDYWTHNTVLSYQENGLPAQVQFAPFYYMFNNGGWNYSQYDDMFVITFPGVVIADYSAEISYTGKFEDTDENVYAVGSVTLGGDVANAKVTVVPGKDNIEDAYYGIEDGTLENVVEMTESGEVKVPMPANAQTGNYTMAVVTYDATGAAQEYNYVTFKYTNAETPAANWDLTKPLVGTYTYAQFFEGDDEGLTMTPNGDGTFTISHWGYDVDFTFTLNDDNTLTFEDQYIGYTHDAYGDVYIRDLGLYEGQEVGTYSPEEGVFTFQTYYFVEAGYFGYGPETFTITGYAGSSAKAKAAKVKKSNKKLANHKATAKLPISRTQKIGKSVYSSIPRNVKPTRI